MGRKIFYKFSVYKYFLKNLIPQCGNQVKYVSQTLKNFVYRTKSDSQDPDQPAAIFPSVIMFVLRFLGPVNPIGSC